LRRKGREVLIYEDGQYIYLSIKSGVKKLQRGKRGRE